MTHSADQQEHEVPNNTLNANLLQCNGKSLMHGVVEDWRCTCMPKFGAHILWGNDVDEARRTVTKILVPPNIGPPGPIFMKKSVPPD